MNNSAHKDHKELTIPQLRDLVVLNRNAESDATHTNGNHKYYLTSNEFYKYFNNKWMNVDEFVAGMSFEPIEKKEMKEYLRKNSDGKYILEVTDEREAQEPHAKHWIKVPDGAHTATLSYGFFIFWMDGANFSVGHDKQWDTRAVSLKNYIMNHGDKVKIIWQRHTKSDKPTLNETCAEIEKVRQAIKSDGGSSEYHQRKIPKKMLKRWKKSGVVEVKDVIRLFLNNDFTRGNIFKAHSRISSLESGLGKDGASKEYDLNKVLYFAQDDISANK